MSLINFRKGTPKVHQNDICHKVGSRSLFADLTLQGAEDRRQTVK